MNPTGFQSAYTVLVADDNRDTVQTLAAMGLDAVVVRHAAAGAPNLIASWVDAAVVNAGDGRHEHPQIAFIRAACRAYALP